MLKTQPGCQAQVGRKYRGLVKKAFDREGVALPSQQQVILAGVEPTRTQRASHATREVLA
jgi:small-conductance mechanosensitive channel